MRIYRPVIVTWLTVGVLLLAGANVLRAAAGFSRLDLITPLDLSISPTVLIVLGGLWAVVWLVIDYGLWRVLPWARLGALIAFPLYEISLIGLQAAFAQSEYAHDRLPFALIVAGLATAGLVFVLTRRRVIEAFRHPDFPNRDT